MINRMTDGCVSANTRTWVNALVVHAGLVSSTIRANGTFWMTAGSEWIAVVAGNAFAHSVVIDVTAYGVQAAWRWIAWIDGVVWLNTFLNEYTLTEGIASGSGWTRANRDVIGN